MTTLYRIEVQICASAYVKAENEAEAMAKLEKLKMNHLEVSEDDPNDFGEPDVWVTGLSYDDERLPELSLSPSMTIHGVWPGASLEHAES